MKRRISSAWLVGLMLLMGGACGGGRWQWTDPGSLPRPDVPDVGAHPGESAVIVERSDHLELHTRNGNYTDRERHEIRAVLTEAGANQAEVMLTLNPGEEVRRLRARIIAKDGTVREVSTRNVFTFAAKTEAHSQTVTRTLRFPGVTSGSLLEYDYVIRHSGFVTLWRERISDRLRMQRYRLAIDLPLKMSQELRVFNARGPATSEEDENGRHLRLSVDDIAPQRQEMWALPWQLREPWIGFRATLIGDFLADNESQWVTAVYDDALFLTQYQRTDPDPWKVIPGYTGRRGDVRGNIDRALAAVHEYLTYDGPGQIGVTRTSEELLRKRHATAFEKALLLGRMLSVFGVRFEYAFASSSYGRAYERTFPLLDQFDRLLVRVPMQGGLDQDLWLDAACEYCAAGQVEPEFVGGEALLMRWREAPNVALQRYLAARSGLYVPQTGLDVSFVPIEAVSARAEELRLTYDVALDTQGNIEVTAIEERGGAAAVAWMLKTRDWKMDQWRKDAAAEVEWRFPSGRLIGTEAASCDRRQGECRRTYRFAVSRYASTEEGRMAVPLAVFSLDLDREMLGKERTTDLFWQREANFAESAILRLPPGFVVADQPPPVQVTAAGLGASVAVRVARTSVLVERRLSIQKGRFPASEYSRVREVLADFTGMRKKRIVLEPAKAP